MKKIKVKSILFWIVGIIAILFLSVALIESTTGQLNTFKGGANQTDQSYVRENLVYGLICIGLLLCISPKKFIAIAKQMLQ